MKKISLTIGIPAYNEEANIANLLADMTKQKQIGYVLEQVIVCSDASTDKTVSIARSFSGLPVSLLVHTKRTGKARVLNSIIERTSTDVLIILDADTHVNDPFFVAKLVAPIREGSADLCGAKPMELPAQTFLEALLTASMEWKRELFGAVRNGSNIYTCHGRCRAFSRRLYREIRFKHSANEDPYSYLYCTFHEFKYRYVSQAVLWYRLPQTLRDHELQSLRFFQSKTLSNKEFGEKFVTQAYQLPKAMIIKTITHAIARRPLLVLYFILTICLGIQSKLTRGISNQWVISQSSKVLNKNISL